MRRLAAIVLILLIPAPSFAQLPTAGEAMNKVDATTTAKKKAPEEMDFTEGEEVVGTLVKPVGDDIDGETRGKRPSLIKARGDFVVEILKSVEEI